MLPKPCWILCTPRTGSSFLCDLLNNTNIYPEYQHPELDKVRGKYLKKGQSFNEWIRFYFSPTELLYNPPIYSKIIFHQYLEAMMGIAKDKRYNVGWYPQKHDQKLTDKLNICYNSNFINKIFPDIKYIYLKRDPISHAVSLYFARMTRKYHIFNKNELNNYKNMAIPMKEAKLIECYEDAVIYNTIWDEFLLDSNCLIIQYKDLIDQTQTVLEKTMKYLEVDFNAKDVIEQTKKSQNILRMTRKEAELFEKKLISLL